jgi:hippurate hydrolase
MVSRDFHLDCHGIFDHFLKNKPRQIFPRPIGIIPDVQELLMRSLARPMTGLALAASLACAFAQSSRSPRNAAAAEEWSAQIRLAVDQIYPEAEKLYLQLHQTPELSLHEEKTAARLVEELQQRGLAVTTGVGGHGIVGVMKNGEGPVVMVRTDLDALPVIENTGLPYASKVRAKDDQGNEVGVMHACGHDLHMTVFAGVARILSQMKNRWRGTLIFVGQPAEERGGGALAMLADGLFTRFPRPQYALALHTSATLAAGQVAYCAGYALASVSSVDLTIRGVGGHGAYPHTAKDPVVIAAQVVLALQTIVSREIKPLEPAVVTVGSIHGGTKHNIIPDEVKMQLTLRSYSDEVRAQTLSALHRIVKGIAEAAGVPPERLPVVKVQDEFTPATYNDPKLVERLVPVFTKTLGAQNVTRAEPVMGGEDFGQYGRVEPKIPICMFWLGTVDENKLAESRRNGTGLPSLHSSEFAPAAEPAIKTGILAMAAAVLDLLHPE